MNDDSHQRELIRVLQIVGELDLHVANGDITINEIRRKVRTIDRILTKLLA